MQSFESYLEKKQYAAISIKWYVNYIERLEDFLRDRQIKSEHLLYQHLLDYVEFRQSKGESKRHINDQLGAIRRWCEYLVEAEKLPYNPASDLHLKGVSRKLPVDLWSREELDSFYEHMPTKTPIQWRNKIMTGLIVYQALRKKELAILTEDLVDFGKATIGIPPTSRTNGRTLKLQSEQLLHLQHYFYEVRYKLLLMSNIPTALLLVDSAYHRFQNIETVYRYYLRKSELKSEKKLRASVIANWLKQYPLRQVQYMAGHKYISSTERYLALNLEDLQNAILQYHPFS